MKAPSKQQKNAIMHLSGPAQVIAGPGSGKTFTIIQRILYLVYQCQISPDRILVITYTKAAAKEMRDRFKEAVSENLQNQTKDMNIACEKVHFGTFHGICWQILRSSGKGPGERPGERPGIRPYSLITETQKRELIRQLLLNLNQGYADGCHDLYDLISEILNRISQSKNLLGKTTEVNGLEIDGSGQWTENLPYTHYLKIRNSYEQYLKEQDLIDFDDMIAKCLELFYREPAVLKKYQMQFQYILADEFQDINFPQYEILKLLAAPQNNLFVVGDDDQAIYGFRGASPGIMKQFLADYPQGKQLMLTENYRSGSPIVLLAKKVISQNKDRFEKQFYPMNEEGKIRIKCFETRKQQEEFLIQNLRLLNEPEFDQTAVILRTNLEAVQYWELLRTSHIPVSGRKSRDSNLFRSFVLKDMAAFLSFLYNGRKRSDLLQFMNKPNRFLFREALSEETVSLADLRKYYAGNPEALKKIELFWTQLSLAKRLSSPLALSLFCKTLEYDRYLEEKAADPAQKKQWFDQAAQIRELFQDYAPGTDIHRFLTEKEKALSCGKADDYQTQGVHVCTMHSAKGLEFDRVFLPDVNEGVIPGKRCVTVEDLEEERRLLYVAVTRARKELEIYYTKERGRTLSRYLKGLLPP